MALVIAVPLGIALESNALLYRSFCYAIDFLRPIPPVAPDRSWCCSTGQASSEGAGRVSRLGPRCTV